MERPFKTDPRVTGLRYAVARERGRVLREGAAGTILLDGREKTLYVQTEDPDLAAGFDFSPYSSLITPGAAVRDALLAADPAWDWCGFWVWAYLEKTPPPCPALDFRPLGPEHLPAVAAHYEMATHEELLAIIQKGEMFGAFDAGCLAGFIGMHSDGTMGLLHIFERFRRRGLGAALESRLIGWLLAAGRPAYCDVLAENRASLRIQASLGLTRADRQLFWLFRED